MFDCPYVRYLLLVVGIIAAVLCEPIGAVVEQDTVTTFLVAGDSRGSSSGINETILTEIVQAAIAEGAEFVLFPGDLVYGSTNAATLRAELTRWRELCQPLYDTGIGVYPCRGNHDAGVREVWDSVFSGLYALPGDGPPGEVNITYSFTHDSVMVIALDQYVAYNRVNQVWLDEKLAAGAMPHVFVFGHSPAFKVRHSDCLDDFPAARDTFWNSLNEAGARVYFCGHDHFYDHMRLDDGDGDPADDVHQVLAGTAGAPLRSDGSYDGNNSVWTPVRVHHREQYGYVRVDVIGRDVTLTWKQRTAAGIYEADIDVWSYTVVEEPCCNGDGIRGNVDGLIGPEGEIDLGDLTFFIAYLFGGGPGPGCAEEANADGQSGPAGPIDVADLTCLVNYVFAEGPPPMPCPPVAEK